jgi:uncharacterized tellurite resistance protein B-like protein
MLQKFLGILESQQSDQAKNEAILELMILTMYVDRSLKLAETDLIRDYTEAVNWQSNTSISIFTDETFAKVRQSLEKPELMQKLLAEIAAKLSELDDRIQLVQASRDMAAADGSLDDRETEFIQELELVFGLAANS